MNLRKAAQQALEALEYATRCAAMIECEHAAEILRAALAEADEPVQGPVAWRYRPMIGLPWSFSDDGYYISCKRDNGYIVEALYTHPPRREPLTEEAIRQCYEQSGHYQSLRPQNSFAVFTFARAIERAHGIGTDE